MYNVCGKIVNIMGSALGKTRVWLSTDGSQMSGIELTLRVKQRFIHTFIPPFSLSFSPQQTATAPLTEHYFYPFSTAPTNNRNQRKFKKGNK